MEVEQFDAHPTTIPVLASFSRATAGLEEYVGARMRLIRGE